MNVTCADVAQALESDQVIPVFQPIVETRTGGLVGFEVLSRWCHPERGLILPKDFIPLVESQGLIGRLTSQVFRKAFRSATLLPPPLSLSVNISPLQLRDTSLPSQIRRMAEEEGFPMERLTIEITESALMEDLDMARTIVREMKDMGCRLALDDFGTGYSCLSHLQDLPFDILKVDRTFVNSMTRTRESRKIVAAIVGLAHSLCLNAVAEGIETEEQAEILMRLGCTLGQGWLYGRPLVAEKIPEMIAAEPVCVSVRAFSKADTSRGFALESLPTLRLAQLQAIYDGAPVGLCLLDQNLRYLSINQRLATMNGNPVDFHIGRSVKELYPEWFPIYEPYLLRALQGEAIEGVEFIKPVRLKEHSALNHFASYQPVLDEAQEVVGVSISITNVPLRLEEASRSARRSIFSTHSFGAVWRETSYAAD